MQTLTRNRMFCGGQLRDVGVWLDVEETTRDMLALCHLALSYDT
jgi:hypothetical protein